MDEVQTLSNSSLRSSEFLRLLLNPNLYYNVNKRSGMFRSKLLT
jgi:hypothetical protein